MSSVEIKRYRKKPVTVSILEWAGDNLAQMQEFTGGMHGTGGYWFLPGHAFASDYFDDPDITAAVWDKLHSTWVGVKTHQRIIQGVQGEFYPIDPDVLSATYDEETGDDDRG